MLWRSCQLFWRFWKNKFVQDMIGKIRQDMKRGINESVSISSAWRVR